MGAKKRAQGLGGKGVAWDFAVTSGMRQDQLLRGTDRVSDILEDYERRKESYHDTKQRCEDRGFRFQPLVFEAHGGGWSKACQEVVKLISRRTHDAWGSLSLDCVTLNFAQRLSVCLQSENARAVLRRMKSAEGGDIVVEGVGWGDVEMVDMACE